MTALASESRLTALAHGGGCGCKLAPNVLAEILAKTPLAVGRPWCQLPYHDASPSCSTITRPSWVVFTRTRSATRSGPRSACSASRARVATLAAITRAWRRATRSARGAL